MSTKALKTQLLAAIAMVLVASIALGSSTYAWFASNSKVEANGMSVQATTAKNLVISTDNTLRTNEATTKASAFTGTCTLNPSSVQTLAATQNFFKVTDSKGVDYAGGKAGVGTKFEAATPVTSGTSGDVAKHTFYIRVDGTTSDTMTNLHVNKITVSRGTEQNISKALRVGVVCGDKGFIYAPITDATTTYNAIQKAGTVTSVETGIYKDAEDVALNANTTALTSYASTSVLAETVKSDAYTQVDIYIWYEGEDNACTSANGVSVESLSVSLEFSTT